MNDALAPFSDTTEDGYIFAKVTEVMASGLLVVSTVTGLQLSIGDDSFSYQVGDDIVAAVPSGDINNVFIIKKISGVNPQATNIVIASGEG